MNILLPDTLSMTCPVCKSGFKVPSRSIDNRDKLQCPFCEARNPVLDCLPTRIKRQVYHALRDEFEREIYLKHKEINPDMDHWSDVEE